MFVLRDLEGRGDLLCSTGVSLFTGLGVSATVGFGVGPLSTSGSRVFVDCERIGCSIPPQRAPRPLAFLQAWVLRRRIFSRVIWVCVALVSEILKKFVQKAAVFAWELRFFFAGNDYFLRMYFPDENEAAEHYPEKSFQHEAA